MQGVTKIQQEREPRQGTNVSAEWKIVPLKLQVQCFSGSWEGFVLREDCFPANPDLADILGDMDFDFENEYLLDFQDCTIMDFQVPQIWIS